MPRYTVILIAIMIVSILFVFSACDTTAERTIVTVSIEEGTIVASYTLHQSIELENARLTLTYSDGFTDTVSITEDMLAGFSTANIGTYTLVVEYEGRSATLVYTVTQQDTSITVSSVEPLDFKTEYFVNDVLSVTGAKLRITYSDSVTEDIVVTEGMVTASSFNTKTATGASAPRNMSVSASTRGGLANCMVAYTVLPLATISSFTVTSTPTLIFQKGTATSELTARLSSLSYRVEYSDSTVVNLDFNASYMTITGFSTANTGNYSLSIRYVDNKSRNKSLSLSYQIIEQITEHQVTYDYNYIGVATVDVMTVNGLAPTRPTPTRNGFTFLGWYTKSGEIYSNNPWNFQDRVQQEMTLYARWSKINYTITYVGVANESLNKTHFAQYDIESAFSLYEESREGYVFGGFDKGGGVIVNSITLGSIGNLTLTAVWTPIQYNIVYNLNSGTAPNPNNPSTYNIEDSFTFSAPTRTGYNFTGWKNNADQQTINGISAGRIGALSVTAQWSIINYTITYTLAVGETLSGSPRNSYTITDSTFNLPVGVKSTYTFIGWYRDASFTIEQYKSGGVYKVAEGSYGNLTLYPKFVKNYQIIFDEALGEEVDNMIFLDTDTYAALPTCVRMGYTFNGWKTGSKIFAQGQTSVSEIKSYIPVGGYSITLIAQWQVITYNITYKSSDGTAVLGSDTYTVEQSKTLSTQWGVAGWSESIGGNTITVIPLGSANRDMILYAKFN